MSEEHWQRMDIAARKLLDLPEVKLDLLLIECTRERDEARQEALAYRAVLDEARRAIGDHIAPGDCYATGPLTGNSYRDLVECPACSFIAMHKRVVSVDRRCTESQS